MGGLIEKLKAANKRIRQLEKYNLALANESYSKSEKIARQKEQNKMLREALHILNEAAEGMIDESVILFVDDGKQLNYDDIFSIVHKALEAEK